MNILSLFFFGLIDARMSASDNDLRVDRVFNETVWVTIIVFELNRTIFMNLCDFFYHEKQTKTVLLSILLNKLPL